MPKDPKRNALADSGTLHPNPDRVTDALFSDNPFFDPRDGLQVKYEMLRRVRVDGYSVSQAASCSGLSRPTYYQAQDAFEREGLAGLLPQKKGPRRAHKLTPEVLAFVDAEIEAHPDLKPNELVERIEHELGVHIHPKSIERARRKKKPLRGARQEYAMSAAQLMERYEELRSWVTEGGLKPANGLFVLRRQGLHAWIVHVTIASPASRRSERSVDSVAESISAEIERSPVLSLCTDILLANLSSQETR